MMQAAFRALLTSSAAVVALVPASRIEWDELSQGVTLPALRLTLISGREGLHQQGRDGLWQGRVQVDIFESTYASALKLKTAVVAALDLNRSGSFDGIFLDSEQSSGRDNAAKDRPTRIILDFLVNWRTS